jgi:hypothetical protein
MRGYSNEAIEERTKSARRLTDEIDRCLSDPFSGDPDTLAILLNEAADLLSHLVGIVRQLQAEKRRMAGDVIAHLQDLTDELRPKL